MRWAARSTGTLLTLTLTPDPNPNSNPNPNNQVGCEINWKEGMDVTVKMVQKKQKKKGKTRTVKVGETPPPPV